MLKIFGIIVRQILQNDIKKKHLMHLNNTFEAVPDTSWDANSAEGSYGEDDEQ